MTGLKFRTINQRLLFLLVLPVAGLLLGVGLLGFLLTRSGLMNQWTETASFSLEAAAHSIDMQLDRPAEFLEIMGLSALINEHGMEGNQVLEGLKKLPGVVGVEFQGFGETAGQGMMADQGMMAGQGMMGQGGDGSGHRFHRAMMNRVESPVLDITTNRKRVELEFILQDQDKKEAGRLRLFMDFGHLLQKLEGLSWWHSESACLVDLEGRFLAHRNPAMAGRKRLGDNGDPLEEATREALKEKPEGVVFGPGDPPQKVSGFHRLDKAPWAVVLFSSGRNVLAKVIRILRSFALYGWLFVLLLALVVRLVAGRLIRPLKEVSRAAREVEEGRYGQPLTTGLADETRQLVDSFNAMVKGLKERDLIRETFGRYVDQAVARRLLKRPEATKPGGRRRAVAILMSDIRGYTPLAESLSPERTLELLNGYFTQLIEVIQAHQGIIVDFVGDAILAFFDPLEGPLEPVCREAVSAALEMIQRTGELNAGHQAQGLPEVRTGVGVHVGEVIVGNIGSRTRTKYGIVGSAVNLTQRIQSLAGEDEVLVSQAVVEALPGELATTRSFETEVKGIASAIKVHALSPTATCAEVNGGLVMNSGPPG